MRFFITLFLGCSLPIFAQQTINGTIQHDGETREYILYIPASYSSGTDAPLLFNFHGYTSNASQQLFYGDFREIADTAGFILVLPNGLTDDLGVTHFNVGLTASSVDDLGFTETLLDYLVATYSIDESRVYSTGMSNGGFMSYSLACNMSDRFAAVGSVTGSMLSPWFGNCNASHPTPIIQIHGTTDPTVPYNGNVTMGSIDDVVVHWVEHNNCSSIPVVSNLPNTSLTDLSTVEKSVYLGGDNCSEVVLCKVIGGGHAWPGSVIPLPGTNYDIDASVEVWKFLSRFDINGLIGCPTNSMFTDEINSFQISPNPAQNLIQISRTSSATAVCVIYDVKGVAVAEKVLNSVESNLDISCLKSGIYFIELEGKRARIVKL